MRNDRRVEFPSNVSDEFVKDSVVSATFESFMLQSSHYSLNAIPFQMRMDYGGGNTFLIPEYAAYRDRGDAFLRHKWNYLASIMPYKLPDSKSYDSFREVFKARYTRWAQEADKPENSILYWVNYPYEERARAKLATQKPEDQRYDFLSDEDEIRLNRVMKEIDPYFESIRTSYTSIERLIQESNDLKRGGR